LEDMFGEKVVREVIREDHHHYPYHWYWDYPQTKYLCAGAGTQEVGLATGGINLEYKNGTMLCALSSTGDMLEKN